MMKRNFPTQLLDMHPQTMTFSDPCTMVELKALRFVGFSSDAPYLTTTATAKEVSSDLSVLLRNCPGLALTRIGRDIAQI